MCGVVGLGGVGGGDEASGGSIVRLMVHGSVLHGKVRIVPSSSLATLRFRLHAHA